MVKYYLINLKMKVFAVVLLFAFAYGATIPEDQPEEVEEFQLRKCCCRVRLMILKL